MTPYHAWDAWTSRLNLTNSLVLIKMVYDRSSRACQIMGKGISSLDSELRRVFIRISKVSTPPIR
jgi:hypothetical protein